MTTLTPKMTAETDAGSTRHGRWFNVDNPDGNILVCDYGNRVIRKILTVDAWPIEQVRAGAATDKR